MIFRRNRMRIEPVYAIDRFLLFYDYLRVTGWVYVAGTKLKRVKLLHVGKEIISGSVGLPSPGVCYGDQLGFAMSSLVDGTFQPENSSLKFEFRDKSIFEADWHEISSLRNSLDPSLESEFISMLKTSDLKTVVELGSRARSGVIRRHLFEGMDYTGIDIIEGPNVDIVGDCHELSSILGTQRFDAAYSASVFEHLLMPWKVAIEINKVLKPGGLCFAEAPQMLGMHELPWDYWRISDMAWNGIFNKYTGFKIIKTRMREPLHPVPFMYGQQWMDFEKAAGFASSAVIARKIGETTMEWNVPRSEICVGRYPDGEG